jgi:hypothetical protein
VLVGLVPPWGAAFEGTLQPGKLGSTAAAPTADVRVALPPNTTTATGDRRLIPAVPATRWLGTSPSSGLVEVAVAVDGAHHLPCGLLRDVPCGSLALARDAVVEAMQPLGANGVTVRLGPGTYDARSCNVTWPAMKVLVIWGAGPGATLVDCGWGARALRLESVQNVTVGALSFARCSPFPTDGTLAVPGDTLSGGCVLVVWRDNVGAAVDRYDFTFDARCSSMMARLPLAIWKRFKLALAPATGQVGQLSLRLLQAGVVLD